LCFFMIFLASKTGVSLSTVNGFVVMTSLILIGSLLVKRIFVTL
jgi:hypothetical protein